jgi:hypothetical protein
MPMQIVAPMTSMPDQKLLDAFTVKHFQDGSSGRKLKEPFVLECPGSSVAVDNELPLPDPNSRGLDISAEVKDLAEVVTHIDVDVAAEGKYEAKTIRLPSRPSLQVVPLAFALIKTGINLTLLLALHVRFCATCSQSIPMILPPRQLPLTLFCCLQRTPTSSCCLAKVDQVASCICSTGV